MRSIFVISLVILVGNAVYAQDIVFKNPDNRVVMDYLDTVVKVENRTVAIDIGPDHKLPQNTIFFNKLFSFRQSAITDVRIRGSFLQQFVIDSSRFTKDVFYLDSTDFDTLFISNSKFKKSIQIGNAHIGHLNFTDNEVPGDIIFINCELPEVIFDSRIAGNLYFINCTLGNLNFEGSSFDKTFDLSRCIISGNINFDGVSFFRNLKLNNLNIKAGSKLNFESCILPDTLDLSGNNVLLDSIDLTKVNSDMLYNRKTKLLLNGTDISKIILNYNFFKLIFPKGIPADEKMKVYERLLENLQGNSFRNSYQSLDIEYQRFRAKQGTFGFLWWIPEYWWKYGYDRGNVFKIAFWSLLILTLFNYILLNFMVLKVYPVGNIPAYYRKWSGKRLWFAFVYTCIIFFSLSLKVDKIDFKEKRGSVYLIFTYVFGIVCLAYMANYILQR